MAKGVGFYNEDWFVLKEDKDLIYESVIRVLMTSPGERVMRPSFGVGLNKKLFSSITPDLLQDLAVTIHNTLSLYEDRVVIKEIQTELTNERDAIKIHIFMQKKNLPSNNKVEKLTIKYNL